LQFWEIAVEVKVLWCNGSSEFRRISTTDTIH